MAASGDMLPDAGIGFRGVSADVTQVDGMYAHLEQALVALGFLDPANPKKLMPRIKRMFARSGLETEEVNILRGIARQILEVAPGNDTGKRRKDEDRQAGCEAPRDARDD
jgi:tRNA/rRNA methyltransferase